MTAIFRRVQYVLEQQPWPMLVLGAEVPLEFCTDAATVALGRRPCCVSRGLARRYISHYRDLAYGSDGVDGIGLEMAVQAMLSDRLFWRHVGYMTRPSVAAVEGNRFCSSSQLPRPLPGE